MNLHDIAIQILLGLSSIVGVSDIPTSQDGEWQILKRWEAAGQIFVFEANSDSLTRSCKAEPEGGIRFPPVIHGAQEVWSNGNRIEVFGDPSFKKVRSFYGSPTIPCERILSNPGEFTWKVFSYTKYFGRIAYWPVLTKHQYIYNFFGESLNLITAGGLIILSLFAGVVFWGRVPHSLTLSLSLSSLASSIYFMGTVASYVGLQTSMIATHKIADIGIWIGLALFFNGMRLQGILEKPLFLLLLMHVAPAILFILFGKSGDVIQLGTTIPFGITLFICFKCIHNLTRDFLRAGYDPKTALAFTGMLLFLIFLMNDILVVMGLTNNFVLLAAGFICGLLFFGLSVNERIREIYRDRDYLRKNLELEVAKKTSDLQRAMKDLKEAQAEMVQTAKLASLGTLSAGIAHEINNSLNYVYGSLKPLDTLVSHLPDHEHRTRIKNLLSVMSDGLKLTFDIIKSLKNYTALNQAKFNNLSPREVVNSVLVILRGQLRGKIEVENNIPPNLQIFGNVVGLNQIFMNLITNAIDSMPNGGKLIFEATSTDSKVQIGIADTGSGMSDTTRDRIFEPFFTTKDVGKGTGLGLYIVKTEIERHNGEIKVESTIGKGTKFLIILPKGESQIMEEAA